MKAFFGYKKYDSITVALFETRVTSFDTVLHNARYTFHYRWNSCHNSLVFSLHSIMSDWSRKLYFCHFNELFSSFVF